ncbi:MAG TPA: 16S rRNA (adenine(1518)-N(6)/adenine(1519)-N(6))-dimethyltransferase RsmA [Candidatus Saccharimonadales bacterium]|nr:16S rRNA (adenine(1518)-N(6)/adenine(1519)-N(6))-dimethyltransferase RsmA [Candidatus Saccharimonadales bacterium]
MEQKLPYAKKSLGQHWLHDELSLEAMCLAADVGLTDTVLEVGPGLGTLTELLVQRAQQVVAVEFDEALARELPARVRAANLHIESSDILSFDLTNMPPGYKVVANIPYYLTSNLIRVLSETPNPPSIAVLLVQKEVAQRVAAKAGDMSTLSVTAQYYWQVSLADEVPAELFTPPPKVDSQILVLKRHPQPLFPNVDTKVFFKLVKAGFGERRKKLRSSLSGGLHIAKGQAEQLLAAASIDPNLRAQALSLEQWHQLYVAYSA